MLLFLKRGSFIVGILLLALCVPGNTLAAEVALAGVFARKAVLIIDGGPPRTIGVGERTPEGVRLIEVGDDGATIEYEGRTRHIVMGQSAVRVEGAHSVPAGVSLIADSRGHHLANGTINGAAMRFIVDTGASMVSIGLSDARRAGIDYRSGTPARAQTASGPATVWRVRLDAVKVGDITLHGVDGLVHENDLPFVLLGMSFLSRMDMQRDGDRLVLRKRY